LSCDSGQPRGKDDKQYQGSKGQRGGCPCDSKGEQQASVQGCRRGCTIPDVDSFIAPIVAVTPLQLFAYYMALPEGL